MGLIYKAGNCIDLEESRTEFHTGQLPRAPSLLGDHQKMFLLEDVGHWPFLCQTYQVSQTLFAEKIISLFPIIANNLRRRGNVVFP